MFHQETSVEVIKMFNEHFNATTKLQWIHE